MSTRQYKIVQCPPGQLGVHISEFRGGNAVPFLWLPKNTDAEVSFDVVTGLQRAHQQGREDRSSEILTAGITRAAAEVAQHEAELHPSGVSCSCGHFHDETCDTDKWNQHLAAAILQAAGRE
jgi:hypothetical protein